MRNCLTTRDHLAKWGYKGDITCIYCITGLESRDHLFFECSSPIWKEVMSRCNVTNPPIFWDDVVRMGGSGWKKTLQDNLCRLVLSSTVYYLWWNRNES